MKTLRGRLVAATLSALALTLMLTIAIGAVLTRQQVDQTQVSALARQADGIAIARRESVSYVNGTQLLAGGELAIVNPRPFFARLVPDVDRSSNGTTTYQGKRYIFSYRTIPARGLLLLRPASVNSAAWHPFLGDLLLAGARGRGARGAACRSSSRARSSGRFGGSPRRATRSRPARRRRRLPEEGARELASLAQAFNEMAEQLAVSRESERNFLLSVSHELKTPLTAIRGYAEGLSEGAFGAEDASRTILVEARRLERLVRDLLDLARMNRREFSVRREAVDLGEVAREAAARHEAAAREFEVSLAAEGGESWVEGDHDRLIQVASNLVENALRETPLGGTVTVRAEPRRLVVSDTGPGLELDDLPHVFDRFFLYDKYGRERPVGSGLGLAIVRQLTEAMGGTIAVESAPGQRGHLRRDAAAGARPAPAGGSSRRRSAEIATASPPQERRCEVSTTWKSAPVSRLEAVEVVVRPARVGGAADVPGRAVVGQDHPVALQRRQDDARLGREPARVEARLQAHPETHRRERRVGRRARVVAGRVDVGAARLGRREPQRVVDRSGGDLVVAGEPGEDR